MSKWIDFNWKEVYLNEEASRFLKPWNVLASDFDGTMVDTDLWKKVFYQLLEDPFYWLKFKRKRFKNLLLPKKHREAIQEGAEWKINWLDSKKCWDVLRLHEDICKIAFDRNFPDSKYEDFVSKMIILDNLITEIDSTFLFHYFDWEILMRTRFLSWLNEREVSYLTIQALSSENKIRVCDLELWHDFEIDRSIWAIKNTANIITHANEIWVEVNVITANLESVVRAAVNNINPYSKTVESVYGSRLTEKEDKKGRTIYWPEIDWLAVYWPEKERVISEIWNVDWFIWDSYHWDWPAMKKVVEDWWMAIIIWYDYDTIRKRFQPIINELKCSWVNELKERMIFASIQNNNL